MRLLGGLNEIRYVKYIAQHLEHRIKHFVLLSYIVWPLHCH